MAQWNKIVSGFDGEDETANFGSRNFAENNGSIYETWTLATIEPNDNHEGSSYTRNPNVTAAIWNMKTCVVVDTCLTIFYDQTCKDVLSSIGFDTPITSYCLSSDGTYLCVAVTNATIHCFMLDRGGQQMFTIDFEKKYMCSRIVKVYFCEENHAQVIVLTSIGEIYRVDVSNRSSKQDQMFDYCQVLKSVDLMPRNSLIEYALQVDSDEHNTGTWTDNGMQLITVGKELSILPDGISSNLQELPYKYTKLQLFNDYKAMICLRSDGYLSTICIRTLLETKIWDGLVKDFLTIKEKTHGSNQMLILMAPRHGELSTSLHLISFPDFNIIYTMTVSSSTYLVDVIDGTIDRLLFLEGIQTSEGRLNVIRIKAIEEGIPELRLQRLLRQKRFDEARAFANKFELDDESVYRVEASMFMNCLCPKRNDGEFLDMKSFETILDKISDVTFIHQCCSNIESYDYADTRNLFEYVRKRIIRYIDENEGITRNSFCSLLQDVSDTLKKLETFEFIQKTELADRTSDRSHLNRWHKFRKADLLGECIEYLSLGELNVAALIWIRHTSSFSTRVTKNTVIDILGAIPENSQPCKLWPWLRHFIPSVSSFLPGALAEIIKWGCKKTKSFETFYRSNWPNIGLEFANGLIELLISDGYNVRFQFHEQYANKNSEFHHLMRLVQGMNDLLELKSRYNLTLSLNTYLGDPIDVINLLLSKAHIDCLTDLIENFLHQYMLHHSLQNDKTLSSFIQNTLSNSKDWWVWERAPWDKRVVVVIGYIQNIQNRLQQTLHVLKIAPVPWSEALNQLAENSYVYDHPLVSQIRSESNSVAEKLILKKYGFAHTRQCPNLFRSIVKQNRHSMIDDIFELTKTDQTLRMTILHFCLSYHLKHGNIDNMINILYQLNNDVAIKCCKQLVCVTKSRFNFSTNLDAALEGHINEVLHSMDIYLRESLAQNFQYSTTFNIFLNTISSMRNLYCLKNELNISVTTNEYVGNKEVVVIEYSKALVHEHNSDEIHWKNICRKVGRANDLMALPKFFGLHHLLLTYKNSIGLKSYIAGYLGNFNIFEDDECEYVKKICLLLIQEPENDSKIAVHLQKLCSLLLLRTDNENLADYLYLNKFLDAYHNAIGFQPDIDHSFRCSVSKNSIRQLYPIYLDASMSSGNTLLPLLQDALRICFYYRPDSDHGDPSDSHNQEKVIELLSYGFLDRVNAIQDEHHDYALLKIITTIYVELCSFLPASMKSVAQMKLVINHCAFLMLKKVIKNKVFDLQLGLTCLFLLPEAESLKSLASIAKFSQADHARDRIIKDLSFEYCRLTNKINQMEKFKWQRVLHYWAHRLVDYGISYKDTLDSDTQKKRAILDCVMKRNMTGTTELLRDFCLNFGFNLDDCYLLYLQTLLRTWEPKYNVDTDNERVLKIDMEDVQKLTSTCAKIAARVSDQTRMKHTLRQMFSCINFYHYEIFLVLLELVMEENVGTKCHLCFLQNYSRVAPPTNIERDEWGKLSSENDPLPRIAKWRMPFLPKVEQSKIIAAELNMKTYEKWLTIASILKVPVHHICTMAVMGAVTDAWRNEDKTNNMKWSIHIRNSQLLKDIKKCITHISGEDRMRYCTAALYYVVNHTPPGADLVAAAKECYLYSQKWQQESPKSFSLLNDKMAKINDKYMKYSSKHILYTKGLSQEKYLTLVEDPDKLVRTLYADETIPYRYKCIVGDRPDINAAVDALGNIFSLNLIKIRLQLLDAWLQPWDNWDERVNDSITANFSQELCVGSTHNFFETDDNLLRACYIVDSGDTESFVNYLIDISFPEDHSDCYKAGVRFRALRVLQSITDEETLQDFVKRDTQTLNHHMRTLQYLNELERLGLDYSVEGFDKCSKRKLVQLLSDNEHYTSCALSLILQLYIDYKIDDYKFLNAAIERMTELLLVKELRKALVVLGSIDEIVNSSNYINAWQMVVIETFNKLHAQSSTESVDNCVETLRLLHACPVIDKLEFVNVIHCCMLAEQWHLAAALLPFMRDGYQIRQIVQKLGRNERMDKIASELIKLEVKGILVVRQAIMMLHEDSTLVSSNGS